MNGRVIFYADKITDSMQKTIDETNRRREKQMKYNEEHGITPRQIKRSLSSALSKEYTASAEARAYVEPDYSSMAAEPLPEIATTDELKLKIEQTRKAMMAAARNWSSWKRPSCAISW